MTGSERSGRLWSSPWVRGIVAWCAYLAVAVFASWPLCLSPSTKISLGFETEATVPLLNVWTLWWNSDRAAAGFRGYWNAPIFHPTDCTFAFSEAQPTMLIAAPVVWLTGSRVLGYNVYLLLILTLNGWSSQRLLRRIGHRPWLAFCGGVMCQMLPFVWWQSGVVQLTTLFGIVWTVHALLDVFDPRKSSIHGATAGDMASAWHAVARLFARGKVVDGVSDKSPPRTWGTFSTCPSSNDSSTLEACSTTAVVSVPPPTGHSLQRTDWTASVLRAMKLGGAFCVTYLLCNYWGMFLALLLVPSSLCLCNTNVFRRQFWIEIGLAALMTLLLLGPLVLVQKSLATRHQWTRDLSLIRDLSAHPRDYLDTPQTWPVHDSTAQLVKEPEPDSADSKASAIAVTTVAWSLLPQWDSPEVGRGDVWPLGGGTLKLILAQIGLLAALVTRGRRRWGLFAATFGTVAFGLSLGPTALFAPWVPGLAGLCPYELLQQSVPGFALIRSPFRFALFVQLAVVWLSVEALDLLNPQRWRCASEAGEPRGIATAPHTGDSEQPQSTPDQDAAKIVALPTAREHAPSIALRLLQWSVWGPLILQTLVLMCEVWPPRQSLYSCPSATTVPAWILWLRENSDPDDALICLPFPTGYTVHDYEDTTLWMYWGTLHHRPLVNGYSGFFPKHFVDLKENLARFHRLDGKQAGQPQLKLYPWDSFGLKDVNLCQARFVVVKRSFAMRDDVWQHPITKFRWSWVTGDEEHQLDVYEILPPDLE